jgi:CarboxypepD_reg-like domain/TonB-dependent Receptor Plug Domain
MGRRLFLALLIWLLTNLGLASAQALLRGAISERDGGTLPRAHVFVVPDSIAAAADDNGQFRIALIPGKKIVHVSYIGYETYESEFTIRSDTTIDIRLTTSTRHLKEVVVKSTRTHQQDLFNENRTSTYVLTREDINSIPVLGGEADAIKTLQLLPGTLKGVEGTTDLFVRGGAADQNLVLLDGAPVYNTSHMFGFLSVFNPDILEKVEAINGGFPAEFGGRLSSILDITTRSAVPEKTSISADIGVIASRIFIEQPIAKEKAGFWITGRRTYIDQVVRPLKIELPYFFYDFNGKVFFKLSERDRVSFSFYKGDDLLDLFRDRNKDGRGFLTTFQSGNSNQTLQWNRIHSGNMRTDIALYRTSFRYNIQNIFGDNQLHALSDIEDYGLRLVTQKQLADNALLKAGLEWIRHDVSPNVVNTSGFVSDFLPSSSSSGSRANELAAHIQYEWNVTSKLQVNSGIRASSGFVKGKTYFVPEPRVSGRYAINEHKALKLSYSRMAQYLHRISNSAISSPTDIWYPVTDSIKPQTSHQVAFAYQRTFRDRPLFVNAEIYYKTMANLVGYEEGTNLFLNTDFASSLIQGKGRAYGLELLIRKDQGRLTGWLSYTLSWTWRQFDEVNKGEWFPSRYDRRHNGAIVMQYALSKRLSASMVWEYITGSRFTPVIGQYVLIAPSFTGVNMIPVYSGINEIKLSDTHRLDVGLKYKSKPGRKFQWHWYAGVYNVYNRANPIGITIEQNEQTGALKYVQPGLFGLLPFISYGFKI